MVCLLRRRSRATKSSLLAACTSMRISLRKRVVNVRGLGDSFRHRFLRRLTWSPDGSLLCTPAGQIEARVLRGEAAPAAPSSSNEQIPSVYIFHRAHLRSPVMALPCGAPAVAVRFSPVVYRLETDVSKTFDTAYRFVFAVITTTR